MPNDQLVMFANSVIRKTTPTIIVSGCVPPSMAATASTMPESSESSSTGTAAPRPMPQSR